jgi:pimeloyl-ACP methyl ester carboxylesterase
MNEDHINRAVSSDGTAIAYWICGSGPPLLLIHGSIGDHTRWGALTAYLEPHFTVYAMDRRGRGGSSDHPDYQIEREYEDVVAVVDAVAESSGSAVIVYGNSYGGLCAFGAATGTSNISRLILYEGWPPLNPAAFVSPPGFVERMEALLAEGKREAVLETVMREVVKMSAAEIEAYRAHPSWPARVAAVHTFPREERAFAQAHFDPNRAARIAIPTLLLTGSDSPDWHPEVETVAAAFPNARIAVLEGQGHVADVVAPELVAAQLFAFLERG